MVRDTQRSPVKLLGPAGVSPHDFSLGKKMLCNYETVLSVPAPPPALASQSPLGRK